MTQGQACTKVMDQFLEVLNKLWTTGCVPPEVSDVGS